MSAINSISPARQQNVLAFGQTPNDPQVKKSSRGAIAAAWFVPGSVQLTRGQTARGLTQLGIHALAIGTVVAAKLGKIGTGIAGKVAVAGAIIGGFTNCVFSACNVCKTPPK